MRNNKRLLLCLALALGGLATPVHAQIITNSPNLPPPAGSYISPILAHQLYQAGLLTVDVFNINHRGFDLSTPPPDLPPAVTIHNFNSTLSGMISVDGGPANPFAGTAAVSVAVQKVAGPPGPTGLFATEMLQLDLVGLPGGALIRESPTLPSSGQTTIQDIGGGQFMITSFFDIFTELSLDGGQTWIPSQGPGHVDLVGAAAPEPTSALLVGLGLLGTAGFLARRRK
jgi:hypothetical protein